MPFGTATINFGATPVNYRQFTITDATMAGSTFVECFFMASDSTADSSQGDHVKAGIHIRVPATTMTGDTFTVECYVEKDYVVGTFKLRYVGA